MSIKINFDAAHNPEEPTIVLAKKNGDKIGKLNAKEIEVTDNLNDVCEISFKVYKDIDGVQCDFWEQIVDFKLVYCVEWDSWFEITVELDESIETVKTVSCTSLGQAELGQVMLYTIEINTEEDIAREEYVTPTVLYDANNHSSSLLHRITEKIPHYSIKHVDDTIANIQRMFSFDDTSIYDAFQEIAEEINCLFVYGYEYGTIGMSQQKVLKRTISVYDLESNCIMCGYRGEFTDVCPECGSNVINEGYGNDTMIFVEADEIAESIQLSTDTDAVKNCFKLEAGDDLMTASVRNCNPNGTDYIWYISDDVKRDMSDELVKKINAYDKLYERYQKDYMYMDAENDTLRKYNELAGKYRNYNEDIEDVQVPIKGYPALMNAYYNTIDLELYLTSALMPNVVIDDGSAETEVIKLTAENISPVAVESLKLVSEPTADNVVLAMAKVVVDSTRYKVKVGTSSLDTFNGRCVWNGNFVLTNYSDEEDTATSATIAVTINDDYESYVKQKLEKALSKDDAYDMSISGLFKMEQAEFIEELKKYSLNRLKSFFDACQTCVDILVEQGIADNETWSGGEQTLYDDLYMPYRHKLEALTAEMKVRQDELYIISGEKDIDGDVKKNGLQDYLEDKKKKTQDALDFESYIGDELLFEFCAFRREDKYSNDNYISDGLNNAELFEKSLEFINVANKEIYKSAELQHSISADLNNLLVIKKFESLVDDFQVGNWIRVMVDGELFKLRLISYTIDYDDMESISVEFSDVIRAKGYVSDVKSLLSQASSMATSYDTTKRQAKQGNSGNNQLNNWVDNGLALTNMKIIDDSVNQNVTFDSHGLLCREYFQEADKYDDRQLKIINKGLYVTDDNWKTSKAGIGSFRYYNPDTKKTEDGYGVIANVLVGSLMLSKEVGVYSDTGNVVINENGITITAKPSIQNVFLIQNDSGDEIMSVSSNGLLVLNGNFVQFDDDVSDDSLSELLKSIKTEVTEAKNAAKVSETEAKAAANTAEEAKTAANKAKTESAKTATDYLSTNSNGMTMIKGKPYNAGGTATIAGSNAYTLTTASANVPLTAIVQNGSALSVSGNGIKAAYAGTYEISGHISVDALTADKDVTLQIAKGTTILQDCTTTSSGVHLTITIPPIVTTLTANQIVYLKAFSTGGGTIAGATSAALTVKLLG